MKNKSGPEISKYRLYEHAVQSPRWQVDYLPQFHEWLTGAPPLSMREDFCGSGRISCEWAQKSPKHRAVGLDLDAMILDYAEKVNRASLPAAARKRVKFHRQDVLKPTLEKFDFIGAYNFSFFVFHERKELLRYAQAAYASLKSRGTFFLELAGGEGFKEAGQDTRVLKVQGLGKVKYVWEVHQYDPITQVNDFSIHFQLPDGSWMGDAFTYHWRLWQIRDLREVLVEAGFKKTVVLWEKADKRGEGSGEYVPAEDAEHREAWIAYVVGVK